MPGIIDRWVEMSVLGVSTKCEVRSATDCIKKVLNMQFL